MEQVLIPYGTKKLPLNIPRKNLLKVLSANAASQPCSELAELERALAAPIGTKRLSELARPGQKIAIVTSDITRPMPTYKVLPSVLAELEKAGVADSDITVAFALGSHRPHTEEEKKKLAGEDIYRRLKCVDSQSDYVHMGTTSRGTPVDIFRPVAEADFRICLGNIEFHYFAGYSGGGKAIMPGVSSRAAIQRNHRFMVQEDAKAGKIQGNPIREDIEEVCTRFVPVDFIVNVVLDESKHIAHCVAGHYQQAHRAGCRFLDSMYKVSIPERADIVVVSAGGYPKDLNLYQAQKALDNAKHAVKDGGTILWAASAAEGLGEATFKQWMTGHEKADDMIAHIQQDFQLGGHKAAAIAMVLQKAQIFLYSDLPDELVQKGHLSPCHDLQAALDQALGHYADDAAVIVMPYGGSTLPCMEETKEQGG